MYLISRTHSCRIGKISVNCHIRNVLRDKAQQLRCFNKNGCSETTDPDR
nr:MAG TPA: hypothetical protein [Caudoviricetes sp.]